MVTRETAEMHEWMFCCLAPVFSAPPNVFMSDFDLGVDAAFPRVFPYTDHILCLNHVYGNLPRNLRGLLGSSMPSFNSAFWKLYMSPTPERFDHQLAALSAEFPTVIPYIEGTLLPVKERWGRAWVGMKFTCGLRTNGRSESEQAINKSLGGPKVSLSTLAKRLNEHVLNQDEQYRRSIHEVRHLANIAIAIMSL